MEEFDRGQWVGWFVSPCFHWDKTEAIQLIVSAEPGRNQNASIFVCQINLKGKAALTFFKKSLYFDIYNSPFKLVFDEIESNWGIHISFYLLFSANVWNDGNTWNTKIKKKKVVKIDLSFQEESGLPLREVESMISVEQVNSLLL